MDPQLDKTPGLALPQPSAEQSTGVFGTPPSAEMSIEATPGHPEFVAPTAGAVPTVATPGLPLQPVNPQDQPSVATADPSAAAAPLSDDDGDALDQEWISKAKAIIDRTKTDPYVESNELGKAKADYLRIRFNKQIKTVEDTQR